MNTITGQGSTLTPFGVISDKWEQPSSNQPSLPRESSPELVAGIYLPTSSPETIVTDLKPIEELRISWGAVSGGKGLADLTKTGIHIKPGQEWFWTEEWQAAEREAEADLTAGRFEVFDNDEDFLASLV